jgi:hypothetical protein
VLKVNLMSIAFYKFRQKLEVNFVSQSDTMDKELHVVVQFLIFQAL